MILRLSLGACVLGLLSSGCITTPASATGSTGEARARKMSSCSDGLIEDGEDKNNQVLRNAGRGGYWFTFVDPEGSTIQPQGTFKMADGGPPGSQAAAHVTGTMAGSGTSVYAGMGFKLSEGPDAYDASRYKGISFKAKGPGRIRFEVPDGNTAPEGGVCTACYNDFGIQLALTDQWETYTIPFAELSQQPGWGDRQPEIDAKRLIAIEWQYGSAGRDFDIWVDDIQFVGCE